MRRDVGRQLHLLAWLLVSVGCATQRPTVVNYQPARHQETAAVRPIELKESTIILDARPAFQYSLSHIPRSLSLQWSDFTRPEPELRGVLQPDLFSMARRLARLGIGPTAPVVVVGEGASGRGEEWRLAWTLRYLGVEGARAVPLSYYKGHMTNEPSVPSTSVPIWRPEPESALLVKRDEILAVINQGGVHRPVQAQGKDSQAKLYRIIDVRSSREYLGRDPKAIQAPNIDAVNIEWKEFFDAQGLPEPSIVARLQQVGIEKDHRLIVIDDFGVRSAAVTLALKELGFVDVGNYAGGYSDLLSADAKSTKKKR